MAWLRCGRVAVVQGLPGVRARQGHQAAGGGDAGDPGTGQAVQPPTCGPGGAASYISGGIQVHIHHHRLLHQMVRGGSSQEHGGDDGGGRAGCRVDMQIWSTGRRHLRPRHPVYIGGVGGPVHVAGHQTHHHHSLPPLQQRDGGESRPPAEGRAGGPPGGE